MKENLIKLIISCDKQKMGVDSCSQMSPSCSIEDIAEYIVGYLEYIETRKES